MNDKGDTQILNEIEMRKRVGQKTIWICLNGNYSLCFFLYILRACVYCVVVILVTNQNKIFQSTLDNRVNTPYYAVQC